MLSIGLNLVTIPRKNPLSLGLSLGIGSTNLSDNEYNLIILGLVLILIGLIWLLIEYFR